jgi:hypothetical protein
MNNKFFVVAIFFVALSATCISGCMEHEIDLHPDLSRQVEDAIKAINDFNRVADRTPEKLQIASGRVIDKLKIDATDRTQFALCP